ncbi:MAG: hypothetical protein EPN22_01020 [Nitrospirae bacterium]|nr:MAG: hypothetical protein EPN22_01020 [Nitrospirota bacterium]
MSPFKPTNAVLLYLSLAVLFPSYHGYANGHEFHFLGLIDPHVEELDQHMPEMEENYTHSHSHPLLYFCHEDKLKLIQISKVTQELLIPGTKIPDGKTGRYSLISVLTDKNNEILFNIKNTGLSPPVA